MKRIASILLTLVLIFSMGTAVSAAEGSAGFSDVPSGSWYADAVSYVSENQLMSGTAADAFAPGETMTRAMLAAVLYRAAGNPAVAGTDSFTDTADGAWYANAVLWASGQNIISGYGNGLFGTNDPVNREQIASILWRYAGQPAASGTAEAFADESSISSYALDGIHWARTNGVISGTDGNRFDPKASATRAQVAVILHNYLIGNSSDTSNEKDNPDADVKTLVVYFSMPETADPDNMTTEEANSTVVIDGKVLGNTEYMASVIQETLGADIFRIEPETAYPTDHTTLVDLAAVEQEQNARPAIKGQVANLSDYDVIYLGYPIWWSDLPMILYSFLDDYDLSGKTIVPFSTHGGSGFSGTPGTIQRLEPDAILLNGLTISRNQIQDARQEIVDWVNGLETAR